MLPTDPLTARQRATCVVTLIGLAWLILAGRLIQIQGIQSAQFRKHVDQQRDTVEEIPARPGDIYDRQLRMLATTVRTQSLYVVPQRIEEPWRYALRLAELLNLDSDALFLRLSQHESKQFLWVKRRLTDDEVQAIREAGLPPETWGFRDEYRREYPQGVVAAHVIGLRNVDGVGSGGIEAQFDEQLKGKPGRRKLARDARGHVIELVDEELVPPVAGQAIRLTLDVVVQMFVERELEEIMREWKPQSCCAIVMDPQSGEVLAMGSRPTFDPTAPHLATADSWKNRCIADVYEPGSTFKPFIVAYGLDSECLHRDDTYDCERGQYRMGRRVLHDHHRYGTLSLTDVLVKSSNIGMAKIGERMTNARLHRAAVGFGFGRKTGIELPGELSGILRPLREWTSYSTGSIPMGHELAATPLQLATAHAALANGGRLVRAHVVQSIGETVRPTPGAIHDAERVFIQPETARWLVTGPMQEVVVRGTGKKARLAGYSVFGKTGTAQCIAPSGGYLHGKYISSFVCGAPAEQPRAIVLVVVNQCSTGGEAFGGRVAAPAAARILQQTLVYQRVLPSDATGSEFLHWADDEPNDEADDPPPMVPLPLSAEEEEPDVELPAIPPLDLATPMDRSEDGPR